MDKLRFIDIGVNLTDPVFRGVHYGRRKHEDDLQGVLARSRIMGVKSMIVTGGSLTESKQALDLAKEQGLYATVGCHPTRSKDFDQCEGGPTAYLDALDNLIQEHLEGKGRVVAVGECGLGSALSAFTAIGQPTQELDYDRLHLSSSDTQKTHFRSQLMLAKKYHLPLFLHSRAAHADFVRILREEGYGKNGGQALGGKGGVVHSFTGTIEEVTELMDMGLHISINGCSLKTEENLRAMKNIRPERLLMETDAPWCSMTSGHASKAYLDELPASLRASYFPPAMKAEKFIYGMPVKGRNEPTTIGGVAWVAHRLLGLPLEQLTERVWTNTVELFGLYDITSNDVTQ